MPRKKTTTTTAITPPSLSAKKLKRQLPTVEIPDPKSNTRATRSSKRIKTSSDGATPSHSSPKKSKYFDHPSDENEAEDDEEEEENVSDEQDSASGYEDEVASEQPTSEQSSEEEEYNSDSSIDKRKVKRGRKPKSKQSRDEQILVGKNDLWREGVKTGLGPGKAVYIEKPKARGDGGIKYVPERLHPNTLEFLKDLKKNNDRVWLKAHDADYRQSWKDFESFVEALTEKIAEVDETIPELPPKDLVFRIYRDVRFSSDPTPYKPHFSAAWSRTGRKGPYACYYVHIQPGERCFLGSGLWHPDAAPVALLRTEIDQRSERLRGVLMEPRMRKQIFGGVAKDEKKAVRAFCEQNKENALKTKPKVSVGCDRKDDFQIR